MKKEFSKEAYIERIKQLADIEGTRKKTKSTSLGTLIDYVVADNGVAYGIVKEQHDYYIKKSALSENLDDVSVYTYIGGLENKPKYKYSKLSEAEKNRNFIIKTVNESLSFKGKKRLTNEDDVDDKIKDVETKAGELDDIKTKSAEDEMMAGLEAEPKDDEGSLEIEKEPSDDSEEEIDIKKNDKEEVSDEEEDENLNALQSKVAKIAQEIKEKDLDKSELTWILKRFISGFLPSKGEDNSKNKMALIDDDDRHEIADKILKVVPEEEFEDLSKNVADSEKRNPLGVKEPDVSEELCVECGGFDVYAESKGYTKESLMECNIEEICSLISGYANAYNDGMNDGNFELVALFAKPEILKKLKDEYGHDDYVNKLSPYVYKLNECGAEEKSKQIDELWKGLGAVFGKVKGDVGGAVKAGAEKVGGAVKAAAEKVSQYGSELKKKYHTAEIPNDLNKISQTATELINQINSLNSRLIKAGRQPININSLLMSIRNQAKTGRIDLSKLNVAEGRVYDPLNTETLPETSDEKDEIEGEVPMKDDLDVKDGLNFAPEADVLTKEIEIEVTPDKKVKIEMNENINEISTEMAVKAAKHSEEKAVTTSDEIKKEKPWQQFREFENYINPELIKYLKSQGVLEVGRIGSYIKIYVPSVDSGYVILKISKENYEIEQGYSANKIRPDFIRKLPRIIKRVQDDLKTENYSKPIEKKTPEQTSLQEETEKKLRKYIRERLMVLSGLKKDVINESNKSEKLKKLDKIIEEQFNLYKENFDKVIQEKWEKDVEIKKTGEHAPKTIEQLEKELAALKKRSKSYQERGEKVPKKIREKMSEINFAIRAKRGWKEDDDVAEIEDSEIEEALGDIVKKAAFKFAQTGTGKLKLQKELRKVFHELKPEEYKPWVHKFAQLQQHYDANRKYIDSVSDENAHEVLQGIVDDEYGVGLIKYHFGQKKLIYIPHEQVGSDVHSTLTPRE